MINERTTDMSYVEMTQLILPNDTNLLGNLLGGRLLHWIDISAAMVASRHSNKTVATVAMDEVEFRHPVKMGDIVTLKARITWVGKSSMEVLVKSYAEDIKTGKIVLANKAFLTFVALDDDGKSSLVPKLKLQNEQEEIEFKQAIIRRNERLLKRSREI